MKKKYSSSINCMVIIFLIVSLSITSLKIVEAGENSVEPPKQPLYGLGGSDYKHLDVLRYSYGEGGKQYWIFEPASPKPDSAPIIVFNHGWSALNPIFYQAWIDHIVRKGNIVIYPRYQESIFTNSDEFTPNTIWSIKDAIKRLNSTGHVKPEMDKFALVGHSAGGLISINIASIAREEGLPVPKAVFCVQPGKSRTESDSLGPAFEDLSNIPEDTLILTMSGDRDDIVGSDDSKKIIDKASSVKDKNKNYIEMVSDEYGTPPLIADHIAPLAMKIDFGGNKFHYLVNSLDYYGTWKLFDGLYEAAFYGRNREYALGNNTDQRYMGKWSDGTPVKELIIYN
ncbi:MAG: alpha/beta hydrolase [Methanobacteriaceae archaeon]|nr:alpha/beta hydrolase [Methanobacteriaceae archaeon]